MGLIGAVMGMGEVQGEDTVDMEMTLGEECRLESGVEGSNRLGQLEGDTAVETTEVGEVEVEEDGSGICMRVVLCISSEGVYGTKRIGTAIARSPLSKESMAFYCTSLLFKNQSYKSFSYSPMPGAVCTSQLT